MPAFRSSAQSNILEKIVPRVFCPGFKIERLIHIVLGLVVGCLPPFRGDLLWLDARIARLCACARKDRRYSLLHEGVLITAVQVALRPILLNFFGLETA